MDLASFFTLQIPSAQQGNNVPGGPAGASAPKTALSIFDLFLAQLQQSQDTTQQENGDAELLKSKKKTALQSDNPTLDKEPSLDIAQLLAANPDIEESIEGLGQIADLDILAEIQATLVLNQHAFDKTLKPLTDGLITSESVEAGSPRLINGLIIDDEAKDLGKNKEFINQIKALIEGLQSPSENGATPDLASLNLTPAQLNALQDTLAKRQSIENESGALNVAQDLPGNSLFGALISIVQPKKPEAGRVVVTPVVETAPLGAAPVVTSPENNDVAAKLNALIVGGSGKDGLNTLALPFDSLPAEDFDTALQSAVKVKAPGAVGEQGSVKANANSAVSANGVPAPTLNALNAALPAFSGLTFAPGLNSQGLPEELGLSLSAMSGTPMQGLSALVTQAPSASAPHAATQMVAATMQKSAQNGGSTNITLQLDPPELGRVEVRMVFDKDKSMKALVTTEKPETHLMLQRDAHVLEKALQDAGLDADGGLSFELAQDGHFFDQGNERGGAHDQGGNGAGEDALAGEEILETTMTWHVDPETGHTRYNIYA